MLTTFTIPKENGTFYIDYAIKENKCFVIQEFDCRVKTTFVCNTSKDRCEDLQEDAENIFITI